VASRGFERQSFERISFMAMDTMPSALEMAFRTALLLTGDNRTAESAVMHGIGACEDLSPGGILIEAVRSAVRSRTKSTGGPCEVECLPPELWRLFTLQPLSRRCFVVRILVGLSPAVCAELLEISISEFEDALYGALTQLPCSGVQKLNRSDTDRRPRQLPAQ
jgi:hypothetical protein